MTTTSTTVTCAFSPHDTLTVSTARDGKGLWVNAAVLPHTGHTRRTGILLDRGTARTLKRALEDFLSDVELQEQATALAAQLAMRQLMEEVARASRGPNRAA